MPNTRVIFLSIVSLSALLWVGCSTTKELVVLLPDDEGQVGTVVVGEGQRRTSLTASRATAKIDAQGNITQDVLPEREVQRLFADALAAEPPKPMTFSLYFFTNSTVLIPESEVAMQELLDEVNRRQAVEVQITGHTDRVGTMADNDRLSLERAEAIRDMLIKRGLKTHFVRAVGRGEREPMVPTPDEQPELRNRRVEVVIR